MKNLIACLLLLLCYESKSQCPTAGFSIPDSICAGVPVTFQNTTTGSTAVKYTWDFNGGDLKNTPSGHSLGTYASTLTSSRGIDLVEDGGNYFAVATTVDGKISVMSFGNSTENIPVVTDHGNFGLLTGGDDLILAKDTGGWYAFVSEVPTSNIYKISFGNSLLNVPTASIISNQGVINGPAGMSAVNDNGNCILLVSNYFTNSVGILNFGSSYQNATVSGASISVNANPFGITTLKKCDRWYAYVGYLGAFSGSIIDFGTSISSTPSNYIQDAFPLSYLARKILSVEDDGKFTLFYTSLNRDAITKIELGTDPANPAPVVTDLGSFGIYTGHTANAIKKFGSSIYGIAANYGTGELIKYIFPETNGLSIPTSNNFQPSNTFTKPGMYHISLNVNDTVTGAIGIFNDSIYVKSSPFPYFASVAGCDGLSITLSDTSLNGAAIISKNWNLGDLTNLSGDTIHHLYALPGNYTVTLTSINNVGCSGTYSNTISIYNNPVAGFTFTNNQCSGTDVAFTDASSSSDGTLQTWKWIFPDTTSGIQSPVHVFTNDGTFPVQLVVTSQYGCKDTLAQNVTLLPGPFNAFTALNTCIGETVSFINQSTISSGLNLTYTWNFGDNNSSSAISPTHTYANASGTYYVQLISEANNGCRDTIADSLKIGLKPNPNFAMSKDTACVQNNITLTDLSFAASGGTISHRYWSFGDATYDSTSVNPVHQYQNPGTYTISLTIVSPTYCDSVITKTILVIESPTATFTGTDVCLGAESDFSDLSTTPAGTVLTNWTWSFGDNDSAQIQNPSHTYLQAGIYHTSLTVINSYGCTSTKTDSVKVSENPVARFGAAKGCTDQNMLFTDSSTIAGSTINMWDWNFGDLSNNSPLQNPIHVYSASAAYPVTLIVQTANGCSDTITKFIVVDQSPNFNITTPSGCIGTSSTLSSHFVGIPPTNVNYMWDLGDATFAFLANPTHLYNAPGTYPVSLVVTNLGNGCGTTKTDTVRIFRKPVAQFSTISDCINDTIHLIDSSYISTGTIAGWNWNAGIHGTSAAQNPYLVLSAADSFAVKLVVISSDGCKDSVSHYAQAFPLPNVIFTATPKLGAPPLPVQFTNTSDAGTYDWYFGDGGFVSGPANPTYIYSDTGTFRSTLIVTTSHGCIDSSSVNIIVLNPYLDLSIESISVYQENSYWKLSAKLRNWGVLNIDNFILNAQIQGATQFSEKFITESFAAGDQKNIVFNSMIPSSALTTPQFVCVSIEKVNDRIDDNNVNDLKCNTEDEAFVVYSTYPNPFVNEINIELNFPQKGKIVYSIKNSLGEIISENETEEYSEGYHTVKISNLNFNRGLYFLELTNGDQTIRTQIIKM